MVKRLVIIVIVLLLLPKIPWDLRESIIITENKSFPDELVVKRPSETQPENELFAVLLSESRQKVWAKSVRKQGSLPVSEGLLPEMDLLWKIDGDKLERITKHALVMCVTTSAL